METKGFEADQPS